MNRLTTAVMLIILAFLAVMTVQVASESEQTRELLLDVIISDTNKIDIRLEDWHHFVDAVISVESGHNTLALGKDNDAGVLQITPIYVEEVNRILGNKRYSLEDRFDKYKSIEMFNIMNDRYNPERCFYKAMRLHNPNAPEDYRRKILQQYIKNKNKNKQ